MRKILLIGHDANRAGAQLVLLQMLRLLNERNIATHLLLVEGGPLELEYRKVTTVTIQPKPIDRLFSRRIDQLLYLFRIGSWLHQRQERRRRIKFENELNIEEIDLILINTVTNAKTYKELYSLFKNKPVILFVHELAMSVAMYSRPDELQFLFNHTNHLIAVSHAVSQYYIDLYRFDPTRISIFTLVDLPVLMQQIEIARRSPDPLFEQGIPVNAIVIGGCGNAEWRKGNDLFNVIAFQVIEQYRDRPVYFIWVGMPHNRLYDDLLLDIQKAGLENRIRFIEPTADVFRYTTRFDIFVLCSREDPYPLVVLEAALSQTPVVCFEGAGGAPELVESDGGFVVPYLDTVAMSRCIGILIEDKKLRQTQGDALRQKVLKRHQVERNIDQFLSIAEALRAPVTTQVSTL